MSVQALQARQVNAEVISFMVLSVGNRTAHKILAPRHRENGEKNKRLFVRYAVRVSMVKSSANTQ